MGDGGGSGASRRHGGCCPVFSTVFNRLQLTNECTNWLENFMQCNERYQLSLAGPPSRKAATSWERWSGGTAEAALTRRS